MVLVLGSLAVAARVVPTRLDWFDTRAADLFDSSRFLDELRLISRLGSTELSIAVTAVAALLLWNRCRPLALLYPIAVLGGLVVNVILKVVIGRSRPPDTLTGTSLDSFPSGHMIQAVVVLGILPAVVYALTGGRSAAVIAVMINTMGLIGVGVSRIVLGAHWPTDVIGGAIVGFLVVLAAEMALDHLPAKWLPRCEDCHFHRAWGLRTYDDGA